MEFNQVNKNRGDINTVKNIAAGPGQPILVVELSEARYEQDGSVAKAQYLLEKMFPDWQILVVSPGTKVKALPNGGVYHRETLGEYEIEVLAATEEDLVARLNLCHASPSRVAEALKEA